MLPRYLGWFSAIFLEQAFFSVGPSPGGNGDLVVFLPVLALGTYKNYGPGRKTRKSNFPVLGALLGGKSGRPKSFSRKLRNFFMSSVLADQTPRGRKSRDTGFEAHFGLGQPSALGEIPGRKQKNTISWC